jgi:hypothetical protein
VVKLGDLALLISWRDDNPGDELRGPEVARDHLRDLVSPHMLN